MTKLQSILDFLEMFAPLALAESWDNVGLLVGDPLANVERVMTCLTITPDSADEAIRERADLILTHHPLPFRPLKRLTTATPEGRILLDLIAYRVAIYSPHTAFDSARAGINQQWAEGLGLGGARPFALGGGSAAEEVASGGAASKASETGAAGSGRFGELAERISLGELAERIKHFLRIERVRIVGPADAPVRRVGIGCGAGGELIPAALAAGCQAFVTGEARFHSCLEAQGEGLGLVLTGHYASERFAVANLADVVREEFADLQVWASCAEADPLAWR